MFRAPWRPIAIRSPPRQWRVDKIRRPSSGLGHRGRFAEPRWRRAAGEQLSTIGKRDRLRVCDRLTGLGAVAFDLDLRARRDRILPPTHAQQGVRGSHLESPSDYGPVSSFDVNVNPGVRIYPIHLV